MKMFHKVVFFSWCACWIIFLLPSGGDFVLPCAPLWQLSDRSKDINSISEADRFAQYSYIITVNVTATNNEKCHLSELGKFSATCKSLNDALEVFGGISSVAFYLVSPGEVYNLSSTYNVKNEHDIWFHGNSSSSLPHNQTSIPMIKCLKGVGFSFVNSSNIFFSNVKFLNCGSEVPISSASTNLSTERVKAGLYFYNCTNVTMHQVQVNDSRATGVVMYDTDGKIEICNSVFANNSVEKRNNKSGGGGFAVEFTYCKPGDTLCHDTGIYDPRYRKNKDSTYSFHNCTFRDSVALNSEINHIYDTKARKYHFDSPGQGGGLKINIKGNGMNNFFNLTDCQFLNNTAVWGGGLHITIDNQSSNNSIAISHCDFNNNSALFNLSDEYTAGGAMDIITTTQNFNRLHIEDCNVTRNRAPRAGGIYLFIARQSNPYVHHPLEISIVNCLLESNSARVGSAMVICTFPMFTFGVLPPIHIHGSTFSNNHYLHLNTKLHPIHPVSTAVVHVSDVPVSFQNLTIFKDNTGSALSAIGMQLNFINVIAYFTNNSASNGGAIALLGDASILVGPNTRMTFVNNSAKGHGGAIYNRYISAERLTSTADCFFQYTDPLIEPDDWKAQFNFSGNKARFGGCSIFTSSIVPCTWKHGNNSDVFRWKNWKYYDTKCGQGIEISTDPIDFVSLNKSMWSISDPIEVFPGFPFRILLGARDDLGNNVTNNTIYYAELHDPNSTVTAEIADGFSYVISNYMNINGKPNSTVKLQLQTEGFRQMHVILNVTLKECPSGTMCSQNGTILYNCSSATNIKQISCQCPSDEHRYRNHLKCDQKKLLSSIDIGYWYGPVLNRSKNGNLTLMGRIPLAYISQETTSDTVNLPKEISKLNETLCGNTSRTGILCGECIDGYAVAVNSRNYQCVLCNDTTPGEFIKFLSAYIALTYFPIMIFFILIIYFDIKLASSAAVGFVLYAQIIGTGHFLYPQVPNGAAQLIRTILMTIYGIFNLESFAFLMHPFCLNENFTTLHVLCLNYAVALFPLVMIAIIFMPYKCKVLCCICRHRAIRNEGTAESEVVIEADPSSATSIRSISASQRPCCSKPPKSTLIHAFTAFIVLSYTKFGLASMKTVFITELFDAQGVSKAQRIYLTGHLSFSDHQFLFPFGILAILVLIFIVFLPPLLLLGPLQFIDWLADKPKFRCILKFWPSITIHTYLDTFQGYKPKRRFFTGLHLLLRLFLFLVFSFSPDFLSQYVMQLVVIFIFSALVSLLRPYAKEYYNSLEILFLLNLGLLNSITIYVSERNYNAGIYALECILLVLPLIYMVCYITWSKTRKRKQVEIVKERISRRLINPVRSSGEETQKLLKSSRGDDPFGETINYSSDDPDEEVFQRAARGNRYRTANIRTHPPSRPDGVYKSVVSILEPQVSKEEEKGEGERSAATNQSDSGIGRRVIDSERSVDSVTESDTY